MERMEIGARRQVGEQKEGFMPLRGVGGRAMAVRWGGL